MPCRHSQNARVAGSWNDKVAYWADMIFEELKGASHWNFYLILISKMCVESFELWSFNNHVPYCRISAGHRRVSSGQSPSDAVASRPRQDKWQAAAQDHTSAELDAARRLTASTRTRRHTEKRFRDSAYLNQDCRWVLLIKHISRVQGIIKG